MIGTTTIIIAATATGPTFIIGPKVLNDWELFVSALIRLPFEILDAIIHLFI